MTVLSLNIGQCGNQVAHSFYSLYFDTCTRWDQSDKEDALNRFFIEDKSGSRTACSLRIDMEKKVIKELNKAIDRFEWKYSQNSSITSLSGSGNNWAFGYRVNGDATAEVAHDLIQKKLDELDKFDGFSTSMSLAGGTGSGLGTRIISNLSDWYPKTYSIAQIIWPHHQGEVTIQNLNSILTLGYILADNSICPDCIINFSNDSLQDICAKRLRIPSCEIDITRINHLISHQLNGLYLPIMEPSNIFTDEVLGNVINSCCTISPDLRMCRLRSVPFLDSSIQKFSTETWSQLVKQAKQMMLNGAPIDECLNWSIRTPSVKHETSEKFFQPVLSAMAIFRGSDSITYLTENHQNCEKQFRQSLAPFNRFSNFMFGAHTGQLFGHPRSATFLSNGGGLLLSDRELLAQELHLESHSLRNEQAHWDISTSLRSIHNKAWRLFSKRAYLHHYEQLGISREHFFDCFASVLQTANCYSNISKY